MNVAGVEHYPVLLETSSTVKMQETFTPSTINNAMNDAPLIQYHQSYDIQKMMHIVVQVVMVLAVASAVDANSLRSSKQKSSTVATASTNEDWTIGPTCQNW